MSGEYVECEGCQNKLVKTDTTHAIRLRGHVVCESCLLACGSFAIDKKLGEGLSVSDATNIITGLLPSLSEEEFEKVSMEHLSHISAL